MARLLLPLGLLLLVGASVLTPPPADTGGDPVVAAARGLGGFRVLLEDALYVRAGALRRTGRLEEAVETYELLLRFEPESRQRAVFLIDLLMNEVLPLEADPGRRVGWWLHTWQLLQEHLERAPRNADLHFRAATLFVAWELGLLGEEIEPSLAERFPPARRRELTAYHLDKSVRLRRHLGMIQRQHIRLFAEHGPRIVAEWTLAGRPEQAEQVFENLLWMLNNRREDLLIMRHGYVVMREEEEHVMPLFQALALELKYLDEAQRAYVAKRPLDPILETWLAQVGFSLGAQTFRDR